MTDPLSAYIHRSWLVDSSGAQSENVNKVASYVWDTVGLQWIKATPASGGGGGGGGLVQLQDAFGNNISSTAGSLNVNVTNSSGGSNAAAGTTGVAVPAAASYTSWNSGGLNTGVSLAAPLPIQPGTGVNFPVTGTVSVGNFPASQAVTGTFWQTTQPVSIASMPTTPVTGTFWQTTQPVSGTVSVGNFPASQAVTGAFWQATQPVSIASMPSTPVTGTFWQATQPVSGTVSVGNFPAMQAVSIATMPSTPVTGTFWQATQPVSIAATVNTTDSHTTAAAPISVRLTDGTAFYVASGGGGGGANAAAGLTGAAVPTSADYQGWSNAGTLTGTSLTTPLPTQIAGANFFQSTGNSSVAQLAVGQTFTGSIDSVLNQPQVSLLVETDQPGVLTVHQYITATDPFPAITQTYAVLAGAAATGGGFGQGITLQGNYAQVLFKNTGLATTTQLNINTYYGTITPTIQQIGTVNAVTGQLDSLKSGDNFADYDQPVSGSTGLLGAETYPRMFDGNYWQRLRGSLQTGLQVYDQPMVELLQNILVELRVQSTILHATLTSRDDVDMLRAAESAQFTAI